MDTILMS